MKDSYHTIDSLSEGLYKEKGSKFIAYAMPVQTEEAALSFLDQVKSDHFKARHHCYAYELGLSGQIFRINDDGEPSGTAGRPIYGQIQSAGLTDIIVVVVRYFGGTKLGASGLIQAYKDAAADAISQATIIQKFIYDYFQLSFEYAEMGMILDLVKQQDLPILDKKFESSCEIIVGLRRSQSTEMITMLKASLLQVSIEYIDEETVVPFCKIEKINYSDD